MKPPKVRIIVLKKLSAKDIFGKHFPAELTYEEVCPLWKEGDTFMVEEKGRMPEGFCNWAWCSIQREIQHIRYGGNFPWMKEEGTVIACCTDGWRPVIFKIERINE